MSWLFIPSCDVSTYLAESGAYHLVSASGAKLSATVKSTHTPPGFSSRTWQKVISMLPRYGVTLRPSEHPNLPPSAPSTLSPGDFPARTSVTPARDRASSKGKPAADSSLKSCELLTWFDPDSFSWRTCQRCLLEDWESFSGSWPASGTMRNGSVYRRHKSEPIIEDCGGGAWPTPSVCGNYNRKGASATSGDGLATAVQMWLTPTVADTFTGHLQSSQQKDGSMHSVNLSQAVQMWTTPRASDHKASDRNDETKFSLTEAVKYWPTPKGSPSGPDYARMNRAESGGDDLATAVAREMLPTPKSRDWKVQTQRGKHAPQDSLCNQPGIVGGQLNPTWVEWLMGYSLGWTALDV